MHKDQMEMLSVKSAIERTVQGLIRANEAVGSCKGFFNDVERLVASFFVSQQIDNNYLVRSDQQGNLEIRFSTQKHCTCLTIMLPTRLQWKVEIATPLGAHRGIPEAPLDSNWNTPEEMMKKEPGTMMPMRGEIEIIINNMLSSPDKHGIFPTSKCFKELDILLDSLLLVADLPSQTALKDAGIDFRGEVCTFISLMLDNPISFEVYNTDRCCAQLEKLIESCHQASLNLDRWGSTAAPQADESPTEVKQPWPFPTARKQISWRAPVSELKEILINDDEKALRAYEKAKRAVERM